MAIGRHGRSTSLAFAVLVALVSAAGAQVTEEGHPLLGNLIVGNSAEIVRMWIPTPSDPSQHLCKIGAIDFTGSEPSQTLYPGPCTSLWADPSVERAYLNLAAGDFDGSNRESFIAKWERMEPDQQWWGELEFGVFDPTTLTWGAQHWTYGTIWHAPHEDLPPTQGLCHAMRVAAGNFDHDDATEFVVAARQSTGHIQLEVMELGESLPPTSLAVTLSEQIHDDLGAVRSALFELATGDLDGDQVDEIILTGVRKCEPDDTLMDLFVRIYAMESGELVQKADFYTRSANPAFFKDWKYWGACWPEDYGQGIYFDRISVATGKFMTSDIRDHIVLAWQERQAEWIPLLPWWRFQAACYWHMAALEVNAPASGDWSIEWNLMEPLKENWATFGDLTDDPDNRELTYFAMSLDTGDLNPSQYDDHTGGHDEIVWAAGRGMYVYELNQITGDLELITSVPRSPRYNEAGSQVVQITDLDALPDSDWSPEIVLQDWAGDPLRWRVFRPNLDTGGDITGLSEVSSYNDPESVWRPESDFAFVCGDLDGDAIRLGTPSKTTISDLIQPLVVLNTPPVHFDMLDGQTWDICGCVEGAGCECFVSRYSEETTTTTTMTTNVHTDFGFGTYLETTVGFDYLFFKVEMKQYFESRFGVHFEALFGTSSTFTISEWVPTEGWPKMKATRTTYDIWEYPVYLNGEMIDYMALVSPVTSTDEWVQYPGWETQYPPVTSDPYNVLSYRVTVPSSDDADVAAIWYVPPTYDVGTPGKVDCPWAEMNYTNVTNFETESAWDFGWSMKGFAGLQADFSVGEITTHSNMVSEDISLFWSKGNLASDLGIRADYTVAPFIYRAESGALILDYAVGPYRSPDPLAPSFWDSLYTDPDPGFVLPWLYYDAHGWPGTTQYKSSDITIVPNYAMPGEEVEITATVHNLGLDPVPETVDVEFFVGDPESPSSYRIRDVQGSTRWSTPGGIAPRDTTSVSITWRVQGCAPGGLPTNPRIYAVVDPDDEIAEVHDESHNRSNNKGYALLLTPGDPLSPVVPEPTIGSSALQQNFPNPFNPTTRLTFNLQQATRARLAVYDLKGRMVKTLVDQDFPAGPHVLTWDGRNDRGQLSASGVYFYQLRAGDHVETKRMMLIK